MKFLFTNPGGKTRVIDEGENVGGGQVDQGQERLQVVQSSLNKSWQKAVSGINIILCLSHWKLLFD